ncbi:cupin domain-containing protein [Exiguobacterium sp. PFWT01]|jgi:mannose-1-phosphate guanylyltransferase|uniref:sugar phosphate nucleotidyltransferase n=1 Tax=unclassified Exiguobacterium TaxID=2644629 RepID=UPI0018C3F5A5|nr:MULTISPECIES: sugar phosphate nucleotidyltransferase [unclassified Exiguobacterium]MBG0918234.1 cupin domain-containing protein [Exiguobacterium sp. SRB7LM]QUP87398.1 cupin domain-containing protein [Exiguobacterium sp. PFWT01]
MKILLLSGGDGKRLWPLSNNSNAKQFIRLLPSRGGTKQSMLERVYNQLKTQDLDTNAFIITNVQQKDCVIHQVGTDTNIISEPTRRDTFPAIVLGASYLNEQHVPLDETVLVMPVDAYVDLRFFEYFPQVDEAVQANDDALHLIGVTPLHPTSKYGYIVPDETAQMSSVRLFQEKPTVDVAEQLIGQGALWNCGIFACKLHLLLDELAERNLPTTYSDLTSRYDELEKTSFDYAVVEHAESVFVHRYDGDWKDLGTWNTLTEEMTSTTHGQVELFESTNTHVINELNLPLIGIGLEDLVVAVNADGILVSKKEATPQLKDYLASSDDYPKFKWKRWGQSEVIHHETLADGHHSVTRRMLVQAGKELSYHYHEETDTIWTILQGTAIVTIDGESFEVRPTNAISIQRGKAHMLKASETVILIEVQYSLKYMNNDTQFLISPYK